jgi:hypothetical protein
LLIDDTLIRADQCAGVAIFSLHVCVHVRKLGGKAHWHANVKFATSGALPSFGRCLGRVNFWIIQAAGVNTSFFLKPQEVVTCCDLLQDGSGE